MAANLFDPPDPIASAPRTWEEIDARLLPLSPSEPFSSPAPEPAPDPMTPEWADYGRLIMRGGAGLGQGAGWVMKALGLEDAGTAIETLGGDAVDYWTDNLSKPMQERLAKQFVVQNPETGEYEWGVNLKEGLQLGLAMGAESTLGTMAGMGAGAAAAKGLMAVATKLSPVLQAFGNPVGREVLKQAVQKGAGAAAGSREAVLAAAAAKKLAFIDRTLMLTGAVGFGAGEGLVSSMTSAPSAYEMVANMAPEKLAQNERYRQVFDSTDETLSWEERHKYAADTVAMEAASVAGFQSGLTTALLGAPMGAFFGKLIGKGATSALSKTPLRAALTGAAGESAQEFAQSGTEQLIANRTAIQAGDTDKDPFEGVLNQAVGGAVAGAVMGGGFGFFESERPTQATATTPAAGTPPGGVPPVVTPGAPPPAGTPPITGAAPPVTPAAPGAAPAIVYPQTLKPDAAVGIKAAAETALTAGADPAKVQELVTSAGEKGRLFKARKSLMDLAADAQAAQAAQPAPPTERTVVSEVPFSHNVYAEPDGTFTWQSAKGDQKGTGFKSVDEALQGAESALMPKPGAQPGMQPGDSTTISVPEPKTGATAPPTIVGGESVRPQTPEPVAPAGEGKPGYTPGDVQSGPELPPSPPDIKQALQGAGKAISEKLRGQLWESYSKGETRMAGIEDPALLAAKAAQVPADRRREFDDFIQAYGSKPEGAVGVGSHWNNMDDAGNSHPVLNVADRTLSAVGRHRHRGPQYGHLAWMTPQMTIEEFEDDGGKLYTLSDFQPTGGDVTTVGIKPGQVKGASRRHVYPTLEAAQAAGLNYLRQSIEGAEAVNGAGKKRLAALKKALAGDSVAWETEFWDDREAPENWQAEAIRKVVSGLTGRGMTQLEIMTEAGLDPDTEEGDAAWQAFENEINKEGETDKPYSMWMEKDAATGKTRMVIGPTERTETEPEAEPETPVSKPKKAPSLPERVSYIKRLVAAKQDDRGADEFEAVVGDLQKKHGMTLDEADVLANEYEQEAAKQVDKERAKAEKKADAVKERERKKAEREQAKAEKEAEERPAKVASKTARLKNRTFREVAQLEPVMEAASQDGNFRDNAMAAVTGFIDQQKGEDSIEQEAWGNVKAFVGEVSKENQEFWEGLQKEAIKQRKALNRQRYRTQEVYDSALKEALEEAELPVDSEEAKAFRAGWDHMLAGKTASTLTGDSMKARRDGYDAAKQWVRATEQGKAWYDGTPLEKEKATGIRVKRRMDELRREVEAMTDLELAWKEIEKDTSRIALFDPTLAEGATPGTKRYVEKLRDRIIPLKSYLKKQVFRRRGYTFEAVLQQMAKRPPNEVKAIKDQILAVAEEYQRLVSALNDSLEGSASVSDAALRLSLAYTKRTSSWYDNTQAATDLNRYMRDGHRWWHQFVPPLPGMRYYGGETRSLEDSEQDAPDEKTRPLRHPRLDRVIREGRKDIRKGKDVTAKDFKDTFGFADVDMGEWVQSKESRDNLNYAFDSFLDLADLLGLPPTAIGLGKTLHFSVGRTGRGAKAAAHFSDQEKVENPKPGEPDSVPNINITKEHGDGSLAHEWTHAVDWANGTVLNGRRPTVATTIDVVNALKYLDKDWGVELEATALGYLRGKTTWWGMPAGATPREHMIEWLRNTHFQKSFTQFYSNALKLDGGQAGKYWSDNMELLARAGEAYVSDTMMGLVEGVDEGFVGPPKPAMNNYLVNPAFVGDGKAKPPMYRGTPYPMGDERSILRDIMGVWYGALEMKDGKPTLKDDAASHLNPEKNFAKAKDALLLRLDELEAKVAAEKAEEARLSEEERQKKRAQEEAEQKAKEEAERKKREEAGRMPGWSVESIRKVPEFMDTQPGPLGIFQGLFNLFAEQAGWRAKTGEKLTDAIRNQTEANWFEANGIPRDHKVPPIWENPQVDNEDLPPKEDPNALTDEEADKLIEDIFALDDEEEEAVGTPEEEDPEKPKKPRESKPKGEAKPREPKQPGEKRERKPRAATDKTAGELIREAGKLGVEGIDEALTGLAELFGASKGGRLNSFPAGFDKEAYEKAKPHFDAALAKFKAAGRTLADFVLVIKKAVPKDLRPGWMVMLQHYRTEKGLYNDLSTKEERDGRTSAQPSNQQGQSPQPKPAEPGVPGDAAGGANGPETGSQRQPGADGTGVPQGGGLQGSPVTGAGAGGNAGAGAGTAPGEAAGGAVGGGRGRNAGDLTGGTGQADAAGSGDNAPAEPPVEELFEDYTPAKVKIEGAVPHPGELVQSAAMASVEPPDPTYVPDLPPETISQGKLSIAQLESIVYGNMAFAKFLPNGERMGFAIGDGTGVGKGREIAGFILDQWRRGNKKHIWVTEKTGLGADALRDMLGVGLDVPILMYDRPQKWPKPGADGYRPLTLQRDKKAPLNFKEGVVIVTYDNLRSAGGRVVENLTSWAGNAYEGMLVFDEAHSLGNAVAKKGLKPSQKAVAGMKLTENLRMARPLYVSATMATEPRNLGFLQRLGLWGDKTAFANAADFIDNITSLGKVAMETVARDMKALGLYISRTLSYKPVKFQALNHHASEEESQLYDDTAKLWDTLRTEIQMAMAWSGLGDNTMSQYWGAHQRFFNLFMTSLSTAAVIEQVKAVTAGENGGTAVIQLVNHYGAMTEEMASRAKTEVETEADEESEDESLSMTPAQIIESWIEKKFPIYNYTPVEYLDPKTGKEKIRWEPVRGTDGKPIEVKELVARRDAMLEIARRISKHAKMPGNPINMIVEAFPDQTVEVTGRAKRYVRKVVNGKTTVVEEVRDKNVVGQELEDFTNDKKRILIFSEKGGTGFSYHASKEEKNKNRRQRHHFVLQAGWKADKTLQGMGRTHRTFQESAPIYYLVKTDIEAQSRFISAIANRLGQLGALAMGERKGASQGLFQDDEDIQDEYGHLALLQSFKDIFDGAATISVPPENKAGVIDDLENLLASLRVDSMKRVDVFDRLYASNTDQRYAQEIARQLYRAGDIAPPDPKKMTNRVLEDLTILVERYQAAVLGRSRNLRFNELLRLMGKEPLPPHSSWQPGVAPDMHDFLNRSLGLSIKSSGGYDGVMKQVFTLFNERRQEMIQQAKDNGTYDEGLELIPALSVKKIIDKVIAREQRTGAATRYLELELTQRETLNTFQEVEQVATVAGTQFAGFFRDNTDGKVFAVIRRKSQIAGQSRGQRWDVTGSPRPIDNVDNILRGGQERLVEKEGPTFQGGSFSVRKNPATVEFDATPLIEAAREGGAAEVKARAGKEFAAYVGRKDHTDEEQALMREAVNEAAARVTAAHAAWAETQKNAAPGERAAFTMRSFTESKKGEGYPETYWATTLVTVFNERGKDYAQNYVNQQLQEAEGNKLMQEAINEAWARVQKEAVTAVAQRRVKHYSQLYHPLASPPTAPDGGAVSADAAWNEALAAAPKTKTVTQHMIAGATLPVWDKFDPGQKIRVGRVKTGDEMILGRLIKEADLDAVLAKLKVNIIGDLPPLKLMGRVMRGQTLSLANGVRLVKDRHSGSNVVRLYAEGWGAREAKEKLDDATSQERIALESAGVRFATKKTSWGEEQSFVYIEGGDTRAFETVMKWSPAMKIEGTLQPSRGAKGKGSRVPQVRHWIGPFVQELGTVVRFEVVQSASELGDEAVPGDIEGVYWTGTNQVTLVADNIGSREAAARVVAHEVFGHLAPEASPLFEDALGAVIRMKVMGHRQIRALWDAEVAKAPTETDRYYAKEVMAQIAQAGTKLSFMDKLLYKLRTMLRKVFKGIEWSDKDLRGFIANAGKSLKKRALAAQERLMQASKAGDMNARIYLAELAAEANGPFFEKAEHRPISDEEWIGRTALDRSYSRVMPMTPEEEAAYQAGFGRPSTDLSLRDRARLWVQKVRNTDRVAMKQGLIDAYASVEALERQLNSGEVLDAADSAWKAMQATRNHASVMVAVMMKGIPKLIDGVYQPVAGRKGFLEILRPAAEYAGGNLIPQLELYLLAKRASRLITEANRDGTVKEQRMTQQQINDGLALEQKYLDANGNSIFKQIADDWKVFNKQALDMAEDAGILDGAMRRVWEKDDYVPFYRVLDELEILEPGKKRGFSGQKAMLKAIKGGPSPVNNIIENMVMNTSSLIDRSFKNMAMERVVGLAEGHGLTREPKAVQAAMYDEGQVEQALKNNGVLIDQMTPADRDRWITLFRRVAPTGHNVVSVYRNGKPEYFRVDDPLLLRSIVGLGTQDFQDWQKLFQIPKKILTGAITADPAFAMANIIRDTLANWIQSGVEGNPITGAIKGVKAAYKEDPSLWAIMMAGGGGGGYYDSNPEDVRKLLKNHVKASQMNGFLDSIVSPKKVWKAWHKILGAGEMANRIAVYEAVKKAGGTEAEAIYQARDVLNFSMSGDNVAIRWLITTVPFMNARIQGLYRLRRGYKDHPQQFVARGVALMVATLALAAANMDDDEYEELPEWDKDIYWHVFLPPDENGKREHFRIPKPFELGIIFGTVPERILRTTAGRDTGEVFFRSMTRAVADTLAMNPIPQTVKPMIEQFANRSMFTGSAIVGAAEAPLKAEQQYTPWTSETARVIAKMMPDFLENVPMLGWMKSPRRIEHMVRAYTGAMGMYALDAADAFTRRIGDFPEPPAKKIYEYPVVSRFMRDPDARITKYSDELYEMLDEANALFSSINRLQRSGQPEEAKAMREANIEKLRARKSLNDIASDVRKINNQIRLVMVSNLTPEEKRARIDKLTERKNDRMRTIQQFQDAF